MRECRDVPMRIKTYKREIHVLKESLSDTISSYGGCARYITM